MINIYAQSFMTATRTPKVTLRDAPKPGKAQRKSKWLPNGHWWLKPTDYKDPGKL